MKAHQMAINWMSLARELNHRRARIESEAEGSDSDWCDWE